jgi:hypothetical protein
VAKNLKLTVFYYFSLPLSVEKMERLNEGRRREENRREERGVARRTGNRRKGDV